MSLNEALSTTLEVIAGPADNAVHRYIAEVDQSYHILREMMGMSPEQYDAWLSGREAPASHGPGPGAEMATNDGSASDLVAKHVEMLSATQGDWAANQAAIAQDVAEAESTFGRLESHVPAFDALPGRNINNTWN